MKILAEISDYTLGLDTSNLVNVTYKLRKSARAIILNQEGKIATQYLQNKGYYKLLGGGIEIGEQVTQALKREVLEEVGCDCEVIREVGMTIEYRNKNEIIQISYCYVARVLGEIGLPCLEEKEIGEGQITLWLYPEELLEKMKINRSEEYVAQFILKREVSFLEEYLRLK